MILPNKLKIAGYDYAVEYKKMEENMVGNSCGCHRAASQGIWIEETMHQQQKESVLLHEIIEAINFHSQLKLDHSTISTLETGLYQVLKDNALLK